MAKKVEGYIKLQIPAGKATIYAATSIGPALGQHGVNIVEFTKQFNAKTAGQEGMIRSFRLSLLYMQTEVSSFITKTPPAAVLLKKACKIDSGSGYQISRKWLLSPRKRSRRSLSLKCRIWNAGSLEAAMSMIAGTARSMGNHSRRIKQI